ncbi:haloalkane dehalogenase family protein [Aspergillus luchuensis]|uniref:Haloalkane dehalogenase family protein n=1 Tax=Aspergillus kawachii TaxID=1069201 RepID=A0A146FVT0_ASPKA|nr:haloalkane dehalogenase family protein [Aspergillus luchuensis]
MTQRRIRQPQEAIHARVWPKCWVGLESCSEVWKLDGAIRDAVGNIPSGMPSDGRNRRDK